MRRLFLLIPHQPSSNGDGIRHLTIILFFSSCFFFVAVAVVLCLSFVCGSHLISVYILRSARNGFRLASCCTPFFAYPCACTSPCSAENVIRCLRSVDQSTVRCARLVHCESFGFAAQIAVGASQCVHDRNNKQQHSKCNVFLSQFHFI